MKPHIENLEKAEQCAALLVADLRSAQSDAYDERTPAADGLLMALLPLIRDAAVLRQRLATLREVISQEGAR